jgi:hypothetical protein
MRTAAACSRLMLSLSLLRNSRMTGAQVDAEIAGIADSGGFPHSGPRWDLHMSASIGRFQWNS